MRVLVKPPMQDAEGRFICWLASRSLIKTPRLPADGWPWVRTVQSWRCGFVVEGWGVWLAGIWPLLLESIGMT